MVPCALRYGKHGQQLRRQWRCTISNRRSAISELYTAIYNAGKQRGSEYIGKSMSASANGHTAAADDYFARADCHRHPSSGDDYDYSYSSDADRNSDGHHDSANSDDNGDCLDDSDRGSGSYLFESRKFSESSESSNRSSPCSSPCSSSSSQHAAFNHINYANLQPNFYACNSNSGINDAESHRSPKYKRCPSCKRYDASRS